MAEFTILAFDTELFGFNVAKILSSRLTTIELQKILMQLGTQDVRLVYWSTDSNDATSQQAAKQMQGFLGSQQITYSVDLRNLSHDLAISEDIDVYSGKEMPTDLENLSIQAGSYSHFRTDPKFPFNLFIKLYITWIYNSLYGKLAETVIVAKRGEKIIGMATSGKRDDGGYLGLLAVYPEYRGQNIGTHLVHAVQNHWRNNGFTHGKVITQVANKAACGLYEKCGFKPEKIENLYHFWLCN